MMAQHVGRAVHMLSVVVIMVLVLLRLTALAAPQVWFDVDPAMDPEPLAALSIAESLWIDVTLLVAAGIVLLLEGVLGPGVDRKLWLLAMLPAPFVIGHGGSDAIDLWQGAAWLSAITAGVALAHVARPAAWRVLLLSVLLAALLAPMMRGVLQMTSEHTQNIEQFEANKDAFFADRGWSADSPMARIYERRLKQPQPRGWFRTTNVLASLLACGMVTCIGLSIAAGRARVSSGEVGLCALLALFAGTLLVLSGSRGGMLAAVAGVLVLMAPLVPRLGAVVLAHRGRVALTMIALTLAGVALRGAVLPEGFLGEKSLLFRWHYLQGSAAIIAEAPAAGVGPGSFQNAYMLHRPARSPEEVRSAHNFIADWWATLGAAGLAWTALVIILLRRAARADEDPEDSWLFPPGMRWAIIAVMCVVALTMSLIVDMRAVLPVSSLLTRQLALVIIVVVAGLMLSIIAQARTHGVRWAMMAGSVALVVHALIEMTFFEFGGAAWGLAFLSLTGGAIPTGERGRGALAIGAVTAAIGVYIGVDGARHATTQQSRIADAAYVVRPDIIERPTPDGGLDIDIVPQTDMDLLATRRQAADLLQAAYEAWPTTPAPLEHAARQLALIRLLPENDTPVRLLFEAGEILGDAVERHDASSSIAQLAQLNVRLARVTGDPVHALRAASLFKVLCARDPHGVQAQRQLGELLYQLGQRDAATHWLTMALRNNAQLELDPLKQLAPTDVDRLKRLLERLEQAEETES